MICIYNDIILFVVLHEWSGVSAHFVLKWKCLGGGLCENVNWVSKEDCNNRGQERELLYLVLSWLVSAAAPLWLEVKPHSAQHRGHHVLWLQRMAIPFDKHLSIFKIPLKFSCEYLLYLVHGSIGILAQDIISFLLSIALTGQMTLGAPLLWSRRRSRMLTVMIMFPHLVFGKSCDAATLLVFCCCFLPLVKLCENSCMKSPVWKILLEYETPPGDSALEANNVWWSFCKIK